MAVTYNDALGESESHATRAALTRMPLESALASALARAGSPQNISASNANPEADGLDGGGPNGAGGPAGAGRRILRCDTVAIGAGILK